jgi:hypothetical protein
MEKKFQNKKIFDVIKTDPNQDKIDSNEITPKKRLSEIFRQFRNMDRGERYEYILILHYYDKPEIVEICSWNYLDTELEKVQEKKKIKKLYIKKRKIKEFVNFEYSNLTGLSKYIKAIANLIENNMLSENYNYYFESFAEEFPVYWDYYETLVIKQITKKYSFKEFNNITLYFYENMKKLKEEKTIETLKKKLRPNDVRLDFRDCYLAKEMIKFYEYRQRKFEELFGNTGGRGIWTEDRAIVEILSTALSFDKLKDFNELDLTQYYIIKENILVILSALKGNDKIIKLCLNSNKLGEEGMYVLGRLLVYNKKIKHLDISTTLLTDQGLFALNRGLGKEALSLEHLNLSTNPGVLHDQSGIYISEILGLSPYLKTLILSKNNMERSFPYIINKIIGLISQGWSNLSTLIACNCKLNKESIKFLTDLLRDKNCTLKSLVISDNNITADEDLFKQFLEAVESNPYLEELKVSNCNIDNRHVDSIIKLIINNKALTSLDLYNNDIDDQKCFNEILKCFSGYDVVEELMKPKRPLDEDETISDDSIDNYYKTSIKNLDLSKNKCKILIDEEFINIVRNIRLKCLDISQNIEYTNQHLNQKQIFEKAIKELKDKVKIIY